jgi:hypothetical protein
MRYYQSLNISERIRKKEFADGEFFSQREGQCTGWDHSDGQSCQDGPCIRTLCKAVDDFMDDSIASHTDDDIVSLSVELTRDVDCIFWALSVHHNAGIGMLILLTVCNFAASRCEERLDVLFIDVFCFSFSRFGINDDEESRRCWSKSIIVK